MKRNSILIRLFAAAILGFGSANAQNEISTSKPIRALGSKPVEKVVVRQGESHKIVGYISNLSDEEAKNRTDVRPGEGATIPVMYEIVEQIKALNKGEAAAAKAQDTIFIQADSLTIVKFATPCADSQKETCCYELGLYKGNYSTSFSYTPTAEEQDGEQSGTIDEMMDLFTSSGNTLGKTVKSMHKTWKMQGDIVDFDLAFGYGYLGWADGSAFSAPSSSDAHSLKWSDRWDIMAIFKFFPKSPVSLTTGVGYQSNVFRFEDGLSLYPFAGKDIPSNIGKEKTKLVARYITVPLLLNFRLAKQIELRLGAIGGLNFRNSHTGFKASFTENGNKHEQSTGSSFNNFATFKVDAFAGIEFFDCTFYVSHALTDMFDNAYPKDLCPFSFGVMLNL